MTANGKKTRFNYDDLGQLTQENEETFVYDSDLEIVNWFFCRS
ncbi:MAG: hypothetical protein K1X28_06000 [Parachlamydiales bacterium]|nr:hypothetical protein [Parachlamydiales bacterium]